MKRAIAFAVLVACTLPVKAETIFFVDSESLLNCNNLGLIAEGFAEHKHLGMSAYDMRQTMVSGDVELEVAELITRVLYSFDASEMHTYRSVIGALCIVDRLQPIEIER